MRHIAEIAIVFATTFLGLSMSHVKEFYGYAILCLDMVFVILKIIVLIKTLLSKTNENSKSEFGAKNINS